MSVKAITSRDNPLLVRLRKLAGDAGAYRKHGEVWIEGDHLVSAFLQRGGHAPQAVITERGWEDHRLRDLANRADSIAIVSDTLMAGLSTLESPAPIAFAVPWSGALPPRPGLPTVVLDRLQDAGNVGAVLRSASAFGFKQVVALKGSAALWSPKVLRAGMGAHFALHLAEGGDVASLQALGVPLVATSSHATHALHEVVLPWPCAWVMGHEGQGVSDALLAQCALSVRIPQPGGEESLNVAAAAAVCLYESARQRS
ncbi:RNA methyltransferase [Rhizobacter sp. Root1221]|uniref:TrmH family RNA methyltransferase n=1 Tax=Rhizobacter sp. Root1221 TaxID=1736433 RepID=UPI0006FA5A61|nr:RNA methyltransferase [Rhizobacter sp. Root1221]KQW02976.1 rRNA methyltransferase [Rhizobacter sp. Root1221]